MPESTASESADVQRYVKNLKKALGPLISVSITHRIGYGDEAGEWTLNLKGEEYASASTFDKLVEKASMMFEQAARATWEALPPAPEEAV